MRLFFGVPPDDASREILRGALDALLAHAGDLQTSLRWVRPENLHVTLHFLGDVDSAGEDRLREALALPLEVRPFDVYHGEQLGEGRKSVALHLVFQSPERTLTDQEVAVLRDRIVAVLGERLGAEPRA